MEKRFSKSAVESASDWSMDSALRQLNFACDAADKGLAYWVTRKYRVV